MNILNKKYKEFYSALFAVVYFSFLIINFTHFHHYNIVNSSTTISDKNINEVNSLFLDGSECLIHQFSSSILFIGNSNLISLKIVNLENTTIYKTDFILNSLVFINSPLRAPPVGLLA